MKKNLFILCLAFSFIATTSFSQFKVTADGINHGLNSVLTVGDDAAAATAQIWVGGNRTASGGAGFNFYTEANTGGSNYQFRLASSAGGTSAFSHYGTNSLRVQTISNESILFRTNGTTRMTIQAGGQVDINGSATVNGGMAVTSDKRLKSNIVDLTYGLDEVLQMRPVSYNYTGEARTSTDRAYVGLVAQELQKIAPEFVSESRVVEEDEDGNILSDDTFLKIHDTELKYILVNAIQQQQELLDAQAEKISALEEIVNTIGSTELDNKTSVTLTSYDLAELGQNTPNPFNGYTTIDYVVPTDSNSAQLAIYGNNGQVLKTIDIDHVGKGTLEVNADSLPSGTYSYQLIVDGRSVKTNKMVLSK